MYKKIQINKHIKECILGICLLIVLIIVIAMCSSCGRGNIIEVTIQDGQIQTITNVPSGENVEDILKDAEISLEENDVVSPDATSSITENGTVISISRYARITVSENGQITELALTGMKVQDALNIVGISLNDNDIINHSEDAYLINNMVISVEHRHRVKIIDNNRECEIITAASSISELLEEQNIHLDDLDRISPSMTTELADGLQIVINRVTTSLITEEEVISYETVYESSSTLYEGETSVKQTGENGIKEMTYEVTYVNGKEDHRILVSENITKEAVDQIILKGTKKKNSSSSGTSSKTNGSSSDKSIVSKQRIEDCDGSGHGYYIITYSDGSVEYEDF